MDLMRHTPPLKDQDEVDNQKVAAENNAERPLHPAEMHDCNHTKAFNQVGIFRKGPNFITVFDSGLLRNLTVYYGIYYGYYGIFQVGEKWT